MPFKGTSAMDQKTRFIADYLTGFFSHTELCHSYGISRPTGYKWIDRYEAEGDPRAWSIGLGALTTALRRRRGRL